MDLQSPLVLMQGSNKIDKRDYNWKHPTESHEISFGNHIRQVRILLERLA
jgi:hypothetical protein